MSIFSHIRESRAEMKHVKWPSRKQVIAYTSIVIALSIIIAAYVGGLDVLFTKILAWIIAKAQ
ncbi:MAG: preprotein translocase subunit SecE [Patescibacteria group bacterium]